MRGYPRQWLRESGDAEIREFAATLPDSYHIFDLRGRALPCGFHWGTHDLRVGLRWRHELLFATEPEPPAVMFGWLTKLFGRGK